MQIEILKLIALLFRNVGNRSTFDHFYASLYDEIHKEKNYVLEFEKLNSILRNLDYLLEGKKILEIGCGTGNFTVLLGLANQVTATDKSEGMLDVARLKNSDSQETYLNLSISAIPDYTREKFDVVLLWYNVFGYLTRREVDDLVKLCHSHLKANGILVFDYWDHEGITKRPASETRKFFGSASKYLRIITPLLKVRFARYSMFFLLVRLFSMDPKTSPQLLNLEIHKLRFYKSDYLDRVFSQLELCGNWSLHSGSMYSADTYSNLKIYRRSQ